MNTPVYLKPSILELSKILTYEFWYSFCCSKTKIWRKSIIVLYGWFHCMHKNS